MRNVLFWLVAMAWCAAAPTEAAPAGGFPNRPIVIVMGASKGGITDVGLRLYAKSVSRDLGRPIRIDNRPTEAGSLAAAAVQNAAPNGYTLLAFQGAQHAAMPAIARAPYDPVKGFAPVTTLFTLVNFLAVPASPGVNSIPALLRLGDEQPGGLVFGSSGLGTTSHLTAARLSVSTKTPIKIVHYAGAAPMIADLAQGKLDFTLVSYTAAKPYLQQGRIKLLAVDADSRWPDRPDLPTLREAGIDQPKVASWFELAAPAGTPEPVIRRLHDAFIAASRDPEVVNGVRDSGASVTTSSPGELGALMAQEVAATAELVRTLDLRQR